MKKIISLFICLVICISFASCGRKDYVGIDKAKQTVVDDIGAALEDIVFAVDDLITDDKGDYYKLHFTKDGTEYVYKVDAMTGKIIDKSSKVNETEDKSSETTSMINTDGSMNKTSEFGNGDMTDNSNNSMSSTSNILD